MQSSATPELQRLWLDARCAPPTSAQRIDKVSAFLSVFVPAFKSRNAQTFRTLFGDGAALVGLLCRDFASLARRLSHEDATLFLCSTTLTTVQLFSQALRFLISDHSISCSEVGQLASTYESFGNFNVVALALVLHERLLRAIQARDKEAADGGAVAQTDASLLQLVRAVVSCQRKELTRHSTLEAVLPEHVTSVAVTAVTYFSAPEEAGVEAAEASSSILHEQLPNVLDADTVADTLRVMEGALISTQRRPSNSAAAVWSLNCFAYALDNIIYAKQLVGFSTVESVNFDIITATALNCEEESGVDSMPALRRVVESLRVLALAERSDVSSRHPAHTPLSSGFLRMLPATVGRMQQRFASSWGASERSAITPVVRCDGAVEALARLFVLSTQRPMAELCGEQLFQLLLMKGVSATLLGFVLSMCAESTPSLEVSKLCSLMGFVGTLPCKSEVGDFLQAILGHLRYGRLRLPEQRLTVVDFFTDWCPKASTHTAVSLALGVIQACVYCMVQLAVDPHAGDLERFAEHFSVLAKVVLGSKEAADSLNRDNCCAALLQVMLSSLESKQVHTAVLLRDAFVGLVLKTNRFCDVLVEQIASATNANAWASLTTPLLSTLVVLLRSCGRHNRASLPHNCIELCLLLMQHVESSSQHPLVDRHLLGCCLSLLLTLVNYSDVWELVERTLGTLPVSCDHAQSMMDLCTGVLRSSESLAVAEQYFSEPVESKVRWSTPRFLRFGPFAVIEEPYVEMLYPVKLLVRMVDTMLTERHADAVSGTEALEHLLLHSGVTLPSSYVGNFIARWERFRWIRCVSNVCDPQLMPLFFARATTAATVQRSQRVWLEALGGSPATGQESRGYSDYVHFGEGGGAKGLVAYSGVAWPPLEAYTAVMWVYMDPVPFNSGHEGRVVLWQLDWDSMGRHMGVSLMAHTQRMCCLYRCDLGGDVTVIELPALPEQRWVHVATTHSHGRVFGSQLKMYMDGVEVARRGCPYPAGGLRTAAALATSLPSLQNLQLEVTIGSPHDIPTNPATLRLISFQLYGCGASQQQMTSLYAMGPYPSNQVWDNAGQHVFDLDAPCLCDEVIRYVEASVQNASLESMLREQSVVLAFPPTVRIVDVHAFAMEQIDTAFEYLNNKQWALRNLAAPTTAVLPLHGYYRPPRDSRTKSVDALLCSGAFEEWMRWMRCIAAGVLDAELLKGFATEADNSDASPKEAGESFAAVEEMAYRMLRVLNLINTQRSDLLPLSWQRFMVQFAEHVTRYPKIYLHPVSAVTQLLQLCLQTVRYRDKHLRAVDMQLVSNLLPLEHIFFNWRLLSNLPDDSWMAVLATLRQLVSPSSAAAGFNTARLLRADFVNGFVFGLLREYVAFPRLVTAIELVKCMLLITEATEELMERVLMAVLLTVPGPRHDGSSSTLESHLGSKLATTSFAYLVLTRNMLLRCLNEVLDMALNDGNGAVLAAFVSVVPEWWFTALLSGNSHPISATLALRLFVLCFLNSKAFREAYSATKAECISRAMEAHCHQRELMDILVHGYMGHLWVASSSHAGYSTEGWCGKTEMEGLLVLILQLLKAQCQLLLRGTLVTSEEVTVRGYFSAAAAEGAIATPGKASLSTGRWRRARIVLSALCRLRKTVADKKGVRAGGPASSTLPVAQYTAPVCLLKDSVCEILDWLTKSYHLSRSLSRLLYKSSNAANLSDLLMWPVLVALCPREPTSAQASARAELLSRVRAEEEDSASSSSGEAPALLEREEEEWEALPDPTMCEARSFGLDSMGPAEGMESVYDACKMFFLTHARSRESNTGSLVATGGRTTMSKYVLTLHRALSAEVKGVGNHAEDARKAFLCIVWLKAAEQAVDCTPDSSAAVVKRNVLELGKYMLGRLVSGCAVPPAAIAGFYRFLLARLECDTVVMKTARTALFEWFMYVTSVAFYKLDSTKVAVVVDMAYSCADMLFSDPMPTVELLKTVVGRLLQVSVCLWSSIVDECHPAIRKMAMLWTAVLCANQNTALEATLFLYGSPPVDTFHGGFDLLLPPIASPEAFMIWVRQHSNKVAQLLQSYTGLSYPFALANGGEHLRLITRYTCASLAEWDRRRRHASAMATSQWQQWEGTFLTTTFVDPALLTCTASRCPYFYMLSGGDAAIDDDGPVRYEWSMNDNGAVGWGRRLVTESVDEIASEPLNFYIRYAPPVCLPLRRQEAEGPGVMLRPNARAVVAKVAGRGAGSAVVFMSNAYLVLGTESYISTCVLTRQELLIVTCSAVTPAGDFFAEQVRVHTASQHSHAKSSRLQQAIRLFVSEQGKRSGSTSSQAAFRYSQYYRQLQTESAKGGDALVWRIPLGSIASVHQRLFQHLSAGLEVVLESGKCVFLVLLDDELSFSKASRDRLFTYFESESDPLMSGIATHTISEKLAKLGIWTRRWVRRECSNYMYLRVLNDAASRTTANLGQYPVMPWILRCYTEGILDLGDASVYRDLTKPVGALNEVNAKQLQARYAEWIACDPLADPPYHYGTHYSTAAIVLYYLIRLQPFTSRAIRFQGGKLDIADRLFHSVAEAWANGSGLSRGDVKELIPEFFRVPEFLENRNGLLLGTRSDGTPLGDVVLPPWCGGSAAKFVYMHALSLESNAVSQQLHRWIDLIFGCKQVGQKAVEAINVFSPLSYKEGVDRAINHAATEEERKSIVASVSNFGQTPLQLFRDPHPARKDANVARSTQAFMLEAARDVTTRPCVSAQVVGKAEEGVSTALFINDTLFICDKLSAVGLAKPLHLFSYERDLDSIVCTSARGNRVLATIQQVRSLGNGGVRCMCASLRGSVVCVGTDRGKVIVYSRESYRHRFFIVAVLNSSIAAALREAGPVSSLHLFDEGNLLVAYEQGSAVSGWHLSASSTTFTFAASFSTQADSTAVRAVSLDSHTGLYYAAKAYSVVIFSSCGVALTQVNMEPLFTLAAPECAGRMTNSRITALLFANCSSFAFTNLVLLGHLSGSVSLWCVVSSQTMAGETLPSRSPLWSFQFLHEVVFDAPVTCLAPTTEELSFVVGLANHAAHCVCFPSSHVDSSYE
ncbi:hypothetical protein LSCM1_06002 [Leishmania martiniquensis]|uniref:Uncharacterized protein n=1 Tax=Leishmania martiniquensis TaxID=1580590 RepID=A0A836HKP9_9TRYP|nr:hypothetical protein LSCM1_06002 [Leishmania martiniquensis]